MAQQSTCFHRKHKGYIGISENKIEEFLEICLWESSSHSLLCSPWEVLPVPSLVCSVLQFREDQPLPKSARLGSRSVPSPPQGIMGFESISDVMGFQGRSDNISSRNISASACALLILGTALASVSPACDKRRGSKILSLLWQFRIQVQTALRHGSQLLPLPSRINMSKDFYII